MAQHDHGGNIEHDHGDPVDPRGQNVLDRMMAHRGRHIDIGIRVVQRMKAPQKRHGVLAPVHEVTQKVEQQKTSQEAQSDIGDRPGRKINSRYRLELGPEPRRRCEYEADED